MPILVSALTFEGLSRSVLAHKKMHVKLLTLIILRLITTIIRSMHISKMINHAACSKFVIIMRFVTLYRLNFTNTCSVAHHDKLSIRACACTAFMSVAVAA